MAPTYGVSKNVPNEHLLQDKVYEQFVVDHVVVYCAQLARLKTGAGQQILLLAAIPDGFTTLPDVQLVQA